MDRRAGRADRRWFLPVTAAGLFAAAAAVQVVWRMGHSLLPWERVEILLLMAAAAVAVGAVAVCWVPTRVTSRLSRASAGPKSDAPGIYLGSNHGTIVRSLAAAMDARDRYTHGHSRLVSELAVATAEAMGLRSVDVSRVRDGALLHDVGKLGVPDAILFKRGRLTKDEWESMRMHPALGKTIIEQAPELRDVIPLVLHHQEHYDGRGYPARLSGTQIPLGARIIAVADAYHAMRSDRPFRRARSHAEAVPGTASLLRHPVRPRSGIRPAARAGRRSPPPRHDCGPRPSVFRPALHGDQHGIERGPQHGAELDDRRPPGHVRCGGETRACNGAGPTRTASSPGTPPCAGTRP